MHKHSYAPTSVNGAVRKLYSRCQGCTKTRTQGVVRCPDCDAGHGPTLRREGCTQNCFRGWVLVRGELCCCGGKDYASRCRNCQESGGLIHVCTVPGDAELEQMADFAGVPAAHDGGV